MKLKTRILLLLFIVMMSTVFTACQSGEHKKAKDTVTVYVSNISYLSTYAPYIESQFPDLNIRFIAGRAGISFYEFLQQQDDLPDIMMVGTVSSRDSLELNSSLLDLSLTETVASYHDSYLEQYRGQDKSIRWLPAGGIINGILANKDLFDQYQIPLPTDYDSFVNACKAFEEQGIRGYTSDYKYEYTCLYTMEGCSISELTSLAGATWRNNYSNSLTDELDRDLWLKVFQKAEQFVTDARLVPEDTSRGYSMTLNDLSEGKLAMLRGTSSDIISYSPHGNIVMLPYFGETKEENWLLTVPAFHVALNGKLAQDQEKQAKVLEVLDVILSKEAMEFLADNYIYIHSYNQDTDVQLPKQLENLKPEIEANHMFIAQTDQGLYSAATVAMQGLINGEFNAEEAYNAANEAALSTKKEENEAEVVFTAEKGYSSEFMKAQGNQAASSIVNTLRVIADTEILLAPSYISTGSLYAGDHTLEQLDNMFMPSGNRLFTGRLTGKEIREIARLMVEGDPSVIVPFSPETLPIASGIYLTVEEAEGHYLLKEITKDKKVLEDETLYSVGLVDLPERIQLLTEHALGEGKFETFTSSGDIYARVLWLDYLTAGNPLEAPSPYIVLK